ncbi:NT-type C2 [Gracilaria domingensis]|nr:NT-type C2 [Gracilaria domingensis]
MAQRVKDLIKRSGSKIAAPQGSVKHIGTTPYRFRIDIFVSRVERIQNAAQVCVTCERRGNRHATPLINVLNGHAEIGHTITVECTLFRKSPKNSKNAAASSPHANDSSELHFDEKLAKIVLRKGAVDGKAMGKISVDFAKYIKGTTSTVFADLTLSNGSIVITKIQATMLHIGKKSKNGSRAGSDTLSEITDVYRDDDSIFGDGVSPDLGDLEHITRSSNDMSATFHSDAAMSPSSSITASDSPRRLTSVSKAATFSGNVPTRQQSLTTDSVHSLESSPELSAECAKRANGKDGMKESPSLRDKLKTKLKDRKGTKKTREDKAEETKSRGIPSSRSSAATGAKREKEKVVVPPELVSELKELKAQIHALKKENSKLKRRPARELDLEDEKNKSVRTQKVPGSPAAPELSNTIKEKDRRIAELEAQNESLLEELEENHEQQVESTQSQNVSNNQIRDLKKKIEELEIALKREPRFLDVVNELKVTKVSLALANMEKEQALFQMQAMQHKLGLITE